VAVVTTEHPRDARPTDAAPTDGPEFPDYDAGVAASMIGTADAGGGLPSFLAVEHVDAGPGMLRAEVAVRPELLTPFGNLHGGVIAALCDHVLGTVCYPVIPRGAWAATTEFKLNYLAPVTSGVLRATARIASLTKRTAVVRIDVANDDRLVCVAQGTVSIVAPRSR
jgi:uncharacterized protein (TIGR00369 family)